MKVNMDLNPTVWRKQKNRIIQVGEFKSTLNVPVSMTFTRALISELFTQRWMFVEIIGANKMYTTKRYKHAQSVLNLKVWSTCLARGKIFENVGFFNETRKIFQRNMQILVSFHIYKSFWSDPCWIILFFYFLYTVGFRSIFTFIMSFRKKKYQIHSYPVSNMDDFKTICIYMKIFLSLRISLKDWRIFLVC